MLAAGGGNPVGVAMAKDPGTELPSARLGDEHFEFLDQYCLNCHDRETEKGDVNLEDLSFEISESIPSAELWQKVLLTLNSKEMPPEDKKQPSPEEKADFLEALSTGLVDARKVLSDSGGEITIRRLNRREYDNTMESLLGVEVDVSDLPDDEVSHGIEEKKYASIKYQPLTH